MSLWLLFVACLICVYYNRRRRRHVCGSSVRPSVAGPLHYIFFYFYLYHMVWACYRPTLRHRMGRTNRKCTTELGRRKHLLLVCLMQHLTTSWRNFNETCHYYNVSVNWQKDIQGQRSRSCPDKLTYLVIGIHFNVVIVRVKREYYQNCSVLGCVTQCSQSAAHSYEQFLHVQQIGFVILRPLRCAYRRLPIVVLL